MAKTQRALVIGGQGFLGTRVAARLALARYEVDVHDTGMTPDVASLLDEEYPELGTVSWSSRPGTEIPEGYDLIVNCGVYFTRDKGKGFGLLAQTNIGIPLALTQARAGRIIIVQDVGLDAQTAAPGYAASREVAERLEFVSPVLFLNLPRMFGREMRGGHADPLVEFMKAVSNEDVLEMQGDADTPLRWIGVDDAAEAIYLQAGPSEGAVSMCMVGETVTMRDLVRYANEAGVGVSTNTVGGIPTRWGQDFIQGEVGFTDVSLHLQAWLQPFFDEVREKRKEG